jgi:hypothetical protein
MPQQSRFQKVALIISIVVVLNLFFNYAMSLVYKQPDFQKFCPTSQVIEPVNTREACLSAGGQWNGNISQEPSAVKDAPKGYCDLNYTCANNYMDAVKTYERNVFVTLVILGALVLIAGLFLKNNPVIANALSYGGVLSFLIASMRYWSSADDLVKVAILALALIALFAVGLKKFNQK